MPTELLTTTEVAELFGVRVGTVSRWAVTGRLRYFTTPNGRYRFRRADVEELLASLTGPEPAEHVGAG